VTTLQLALLVAAAILGCVAIIEASGRSWAGWGVLAIAAALLVVRL